MPKRIVNLLFQEQAITAWDVVFGFEGWFRSPYIDFLFAMPCRCANHQMGNIGDLSIALEDTARAPFSPP